MKGLRIPAFVLLVALSGCTSGMAKTETVPLPPAPETVELVLSEYRFEHVAEARPGRALFRVHNAGSLTHELVMVRLPDGFEGTLDRQLRSDTRMPLFGVASIAQQLPGASDVFAFDLMPGRYGFLCFVEDPDGMKHALKGMNSELEVR